MTIHTTATTFDAVTTRALGRAISQRPTTAATTPTAVVTTHWTGSALNMSVIAIANPAATSHTAPAIPSLFISASHAVPPHSHASAQVASFDSSSAASLSLAGSQPIDLGSQATPPGPQRHGRGAKLVRRQANL